MANTIEAQEIQVGKDLEAKEAAEKLAAKRAVVKEAVKKRIQERVAAMLGEAKQRIEAITIKVNRAIENLERHKKTLPYLLSLWNGCNKNGKPSHLKNQTNAIQFTLDNTNKDISIVDQVNHLVTSPEGNVELNEIADETYTILVATSLQTNLKKNIDALEAAIVASNPMTPQLAAQATPKVGENAEIVDVKEAVVAKDESGDPKKKIQLP